MYGEKRPGAQEKQAEASANDEVPAAHQEKRPAPSGQYAPGKHAVRLYEPSEQKKPALQTRHAAWPEALWYWPAGQKEQLVAPV